VKLRQGLKRLTMSRPRKKVKKQLSNCYFREENKSTGE
jgi:hypothetical protein